MKDKTVLVVGGAGAVGSQLTNTLTKMCKKVVVLDDLSSGYLFLLNKADNLVFIKGDIRSESDLKSCFEHKPDIVFHLAAFFANQRSVEYPFEDLSVNGMGTLNLYNHCVQYGNLERIVYASSRAVYGNLPSPYTEEKIDPLNLTTPYQITKMIGESYGSYFVNQYELPVCNARFFNSFGPGEIPGNYRNVIPNFIYWSLSGKSLPITGTGKETRDFTSVNDIVNGLILMSQKENIIGESFNLGAGREIEIEYLANLINKLTGNTASITYIPKRKWDSKTRLSSSNQKAKDLLGFDPDLNFEENISKTILWFQQNWTKIQNNASF